MKILHGKMLGIAASYLLFLATPGSAAESGPRFDFGTQIQDVMVDGLRFSEGVRKFYGDRSALDDWRNQGYLTYRSEGMAAWSANPSDPRRALWLSTTSVARPKYWRAVYSSAAVRERLDQRLIDSSEVLDFDAEAQWERTFIWMRASSMGDPKVTDELKRRLRELTIKQMAGGYGASREYLDAMRPFRACDLLWDFYAAQPGAKDSIESIQALVRSIGEIDNQEAIWRAFSFHPDPAISRFAATQREVMSLRATPFSVEASPLIGSPGLAAHRGKVVLLDLWSNRCSSCIAALPYMQVLQDRYGEEGLQIIGLWFEHAAEKNGKRTALSHLSRASVNFPVGAMIQPQAAEFRERFGVTGFPVIWFFDRKGLLRHANVQHKELEFTVRELLGLATLKSTEKSVRTLLQERNALVRSPATN